MNGVVVLSAESSQKPLEVGNLVTLEIAVDGKVNRATEGWSIEPAPAGDWFPSGSFLLSGNSLKVLSTDGALTKISIEAIVRSPGELRTAPFKLKHTDDQVTVEVAESLVSKNGAKAIQLSETAPPWLLPAVSLGGWNIWLISLLGALTLVGLGFLIRYILQRLAERSIAKWNHRDRALRELQNLEKYVRAKSNEQDHWKKFSFDLAGILRKYSDENFHMDSRDMTDREFIAELRFHPKGKAQTDLIAHILSTITEVRYGTKTLESQMMPSLLLEGKKYVEGTYTPKEEAKK
ncbi:MAG: hypothetical protein AB7K68_05040 [Bacteriovoracia bacterium]